MKITTCPFCKGTGHVAHYSASDFEGERECRECKGNGWVRARDARGRFVKEARG